MHQMKTLKIALLAFLCLGLPCTAKCAAQTCGSNSSFCSASGPQIRFPFQLVKDGQQLDRCGYPGFNLSCNNRNQPIIKLPSGYFTVSRIDYVEQTINVNDPHCCLAKRILRLNLTGSPFRPIYPMGYTFLNCSIPIVPNEWLSWFTPIPCLSGANYTVVVRPTQLNGLFKDNDWCNVVATVVVPVKRVAFESGFPLDPNMDLKLTWGDPNCGPCEQRGGICEFRGESGFKIGCAGTHRLGLSRKATCGIIIGIGVPTLASIMWITCYVFGRVGPYSQQRQRDGDFSPSSITPHSLALARGLDGPTIESLPKTVLGESGRMPTSQSSDGACPICLSEYQPKEIVKIIPKCMHTFHASCVDEWLRKSGTCPVCRNFPCETRWNASGPLSSMTSP